MAASRQEAESPAPSAPRILTDNDSRQSQGSLGRRAPPSAEASLLQDTSERDAWTAEGKGGRGSFPEEGPRCRPRPSAQPRPSAASRKSSSTNTNDSRQRIEHAAGEDFRDSFFLFSMASSARVWDKLFSTFLSACLTAGIPEYSVH